MIKSITARGTWHLAGMEKEKYAYTVWVGKYEGKRPPERSRHRRDDNIKINLKEVGWEGVDWIRCVRAGTSGGLL
jgi:hypothetical protein